MIIRFFAKIWLDNGIRKGMLLKFVSIIDQIWINLNWTAGKLTREVLSPYEQHLMLATRIAMSRWWMECSKWTRKNCLMGLAYLADLLIRLCEFIWISGFSIICEEFYMQLNNEFDSGNLPSIQTSSFYRSLSS